VRFGVGAQRLGKRGRAGLFGDSAGNAAGGVDESARAPSETVRGRGTAVSTRWVC